MKIELNKQLDKEVYTAFCEAVVGGVDFGKKIRTDQDGNEYTLTIDLNLEKTTVEWREI